MKFNKNLDKFLLGILTFILILYIASSLVVFSTFNISKKFLNKSNIYQFIDNIDIASIFKGELGNELNEFNIIKEDLNDIGITDEYINQFVNSPDVKKFSNDILINIFDNISNDNNVDYKITNEQLDELVESNITKLETNSNIEETELMNKIKKKIPNIVLNINVLLDRLYDKLENSEFVQKYQSFIYNSINVLDIIYSDIIVNLIFFITISFLILLIYIRKSFYKSLKWISISFIAPSILFGIISTIIYSFINVDNVLINNLLNAINKDLIKHSIIYFIISVVFCVINVIMYVIKKYKKKVSNV